MDRQLSTFDRRSFLKRSAGIAVTGIPALQLLAACARNAAGPARWPEASPTAAPASRAPTPEPLGYGALAPTADAADGAVRLALPAGFAYVTIGAEGSPLSDGTPTPGAHDGMAAFPGRNGRVLLVRNHEIRANPRNAKVFGDRSKAYDRSAGAGTTTLEIEVDSSGRPEVTASAVSLNGTLVNCAGGPTPWGAWLTCEETTEGPSQGWDKPHGYVFEVPPRTGGRGTARPLTAMGRFVHEAVAVDPRTGVVYETEDSSAAGFYRFTPKTQRELAAGGTLEMLAVAGVDGYDTRRGQSVGKRLDVGWVPIEDPDPAEAEGDKRAVFDQGLRLGGARFARLEGAWYGNGSIYFNSTSGGDAKMGQVWEYTPDDGTLRLAFESPGAQVLSNPDNVVFTPRGGLLLCEDGDRAQQFLRGLTVRGRIFDFATSLVHDGEWAGATFSPDGRVLFANVQGDTSGRGGGKQSMTFAVWGPWEDGAL